MKHHQLLQRSATLFFCILVLACNAVAQVPDVEIYWDETDKRDTVIDFDVTLEGTKVYRTFTVVNRSPFDVTIPEKLEPYFIILNTAAVPPPHPRKEEFGAEDPIPFVVKANSDSSFRLVFYAYKDRGDLPPDIVTEALLFLRVVPTSNPNGPGVNKVFLLRALKTTRPLASTSNAIFFDSVYVFPNPIPTQSFIIRNVSQGQVVVDSQVIIQRKSIITSQPEIRIDTHPQVKFAARESVEWAITYRPEDQLRDSASFFVHYRLSETSPNEVVSVEISGIGVKQSFRLDSAVGVPVPLKSARDTTGGNVTIDFGEVPANGTTYLATIVVRNDGNLNLGYDNEVLIGGQLDTAAFKIRQPWAGGRVGGAKRGDFDTLVVAFTPTSSGEHRSTYMLTTDIKRRNIKGIPDGANTFIVYLRGFGERPQLQIPSSIDFGNIVHLPGCTSNSEQTLRIANVGNATLKVDSITVVQGSGTIDINVAAPFSISAGGSRDLVVRYNTVANGPDSGVITFWTNALSVRVDVRYSANVAPRDSTVVTLPKTAAARPGTRVSIPMLIDAATVGLTNVTSFTITYDRSLLRFSSLRTQGTASDGAIVVRALEDPRGVLNVTLDKNGNFVDNDTLVHLLFDTFLGSQPTTELSLANETTSFGNDGCASVLDVRTTSGLFSLDSICGLSYKTSGSTRAILAGVFPNPAFDDATVAVMIREASAVMIALRDALGRTLYEVTSDVLQPGTHLIPVDLRGHQSGTYYIEVRSMFSVRTIPFVVSP